MQTLTAKLLNENLKKGWTEEDFARYLGVSEPQFFYLLEKSFNSKYSQSVHKQLKKNRKLQKRIEKTGNIQETKTDEKIENSNPVQDVNDNTNNIELSNSHNKDEENNGIAKTIPNSSLNISLEELLEKESILQQEIFKDETILKSLHTERKELNSSLLEIQNEIKKLIILANRYQENVEKISQSIEDSNKKIEDANAILRKKQEAISIIRTQIQCLKKITVYAYSNGSIDIENKEITIPDDWTKTFEKIMINDNLEHLTVLQIKLLAKLIVLTNKLQADKMEFELVFESEELEKLFSILSAQNYT